jgi:dTDP-D-glucose 4,6-dehydratase
MTTSAIVGYVKRTLEARGHKAHDVVTHVTDRPGHDRKYWIHSSVSEDRFSNFTDALTQTVDHYIRMR